MTTIEVMRKALEALEWCVEQGGGPTCEHESGGAVCFCKENAAITALRAELERMEAVEPVAWLPADVLEQLQPPRLRLLSVPLVTYSAEGHVPIYTAPIAPASVKPVARPACVDGRCPDRRECDVARACLHHTAPIAPAAAEPAAETMEQKTERNRRVAARYDELMQEGRHGHYETMFRVVREEVERARAATTPPAAIPALTDEELQAAFQYVTDDLGYDQSMQWFEKIHDSAARWAYALAAERAGAAVK